MLSRIIKIVALCAFLCVGLFALIGCSESANHDKTKIHVFIDDSLRNAMEEIIHRYNEENQNAMIELQIESSEKLLSQIKAGYECDIFLSADAKQMTQLEEYGLVKDGSNRNLLRNQLVLIRGVINDKGISGLDALSDAKSIAMASEKTPAGKYTREALKRMGTLKTTLDVSEITTKEVSKALGGVEIVEESKTSKILNAVEDGLCEVGTVFYTDMYCKEDKVAIIEYIDKQFTGEILYSACMLENEEATKNQIIVANDFFEFMTGDEAKEIFKKFLFIV